MRLASSVGLGIAYAGKARKDVMELLIPIVADSETLDIAEVCAMRRMNPNSHERTLSLCFPMLS